MFNPVHMSMQNQRSIPLHGRGRSVGMGPPTRLYGPSFSTNYRMTNSRRLFGLGDSTQVEVDEAVTQRPWTFGQKFWFGAACFAGGTLFGGFMINRSWGKAMR